MNPGDRHSSAERANSDRLDSWKEIAGHLRRTVRTVQRWERLGLPVRRHEHAGGASVYAYRTELDAWWTSSAAPRQEMESAERGLELTTPRIAVLPFANRSGHIDEQYFADGFVDELITKLAAARRVAVISLTSVLQFRQTAPHALVRVAKRLGARLLVEGSVRRDANRVYASVRLVDPFDGARILWAEQYATPYPEIAEVQARIAQDLIDAAAHLERRAAERLALAPRITVPEANDAYLMGRFYLHKRTGAALSIALERFAQAIAFDPADARGYAGLAETQLLLSGNEFWAPSYGFPKARETAKRALDIDPNNAVAHACLGMVTSLYDWRWSEGDAHFQTAVRLNPHYADGLHWQGVARLNSGLIAESVPPLSRAVELDPLSPIIVVNSGRPFHFLERYDDAIARCDRAISFAPDFWIAHYNRAMALSAKGDVAAAAEAGLTASRTSNSNGTAVLALAEAYAVGGDRNRALATVQGVMRAADGVGNFNAFRVARVYARLGMPEEAFKWLDQSLHERSLGNSTYAPLDPAVDSLRDDPRFARLMELLGAADGSTSEPIVVHTM